MVKAMDTGQDQSLTEALIAFLTARFDEDEQHAKKDLWVAEQATLGNWRAFYGHNLSASYIRANDEEIGRFTGTRHEGDAMLVARFKPSTVQMRAARVLAEVDAKRRIVDACAETLRLVDNWLEVHAGPAYSVLCLLALPHADHPDWREEWRP